MKKLKKLSSKEALTRELKKNRFRVTVFGSARIKKNDKVYKEIYKLAKMIGERDIDIVTGGGPGIMKAANSGHSKGSSKNGATSIGLSIKLPHEQRTNDYINIERVFNRFSQRLDNFMIFSNVIIVAPGGIGTTLELFYSWQLIQVRQVCNIPIILLGDMWPDLVKWVEKNALKRKFIDPKDLGIVFLAKDYKEAIKMVDKAYEEYKKGTKDFCLNYEKYKLY